MQKNTLRFLIIQTAFIGDVILITASIQRLKQAYPNAQIEVVVRKGNESLLQADTNITRLWIWDKKKRKLFNLIRLGFQLFRERYTGVIVVQRFFSAGWLGLMARTDKRVCFSANPLSIFYTNTYPHELTGIHEVERNNSLLTSFLPSGFTEGFARPYLVAASQESEKMKPYTDQTPYYVIAPASVWFTKQTPLVIWKNILAKLPADSTVYLIGAPNDAEFCLELAQAHPNGISLAGKISLIESYLLLKGARQVFVNDSAPLHLASAANVPTVSLFCSTIPKFGFGPLAENSQIIEVKNLDCRPCGLHGHSKCPLKHFRCGYELPIQEIQYQ
ncbi:MAG: glycosyltransferase family 9 protein [Bacteroidia bacterium]|nr:glycosyltransferase family 9 protein [Bacteroidia bacterium]